jgi:hypothetical protein
MTSPTYTIGLAKGQGMVPETMLLLREWQPRMAAPELRKKVVEEGLIPKATAYRMSDIVTRVFAPRYLRENGEPAARLKRLMEHGLAREKLTQLFLIYTAREHLILHDFIRDVFWKHYHAGARTLQRQEALEFLRSARAMGRISKSWSDAVNLRMTRYLLSSLTDFKLTRDLPRGRREILPFTLLTSTTIYLAHDIHFRGVNDNSILEHPDWSLFGLDRTGVVQELRRAAEGHFIVQFSGELLRISWKHKTMEECLDAIAE